ncbi:hypothetical protein [Parasphingorhabdus pacifica]
MAARSPEDPEGAGVHALLGASQLPVPVPNVGPLDVPLGLFSPLVLAVLLGLHLRPPTRLWDTSPRGHGLVRAGLVAGALLLAVLASTPLLLHGTALWASGVRNVLGLVGMVLLTAVVAGASRCWMAAFPYALAVLLLGTSGSTITGDRSAHAWWAFVLQDATDSRGGLLAGLLLAAGVLAYVRRGMRAE